MIIKKFNREMAYPIEIECTPQILLQALDTARPVAMFSLDRAIDRTGSVCREVL